MKTFWCNISWWGIFILILIVGSVYIWRKGALEWS